MRDISGMSDEECCLATLEAKYSSCELFCVKREWSVCNNECSWTCAVHARGANQSPLSPCSQPAIRLPSLSLLRDGPNPKTAFFEYATFNSQPEECHLQDESGILLAAQWLVRQHPPETPFLRAPSAWMFGMARLDVTPRSDSCSPKRKFQVSTIPSREQQQDQC